MTRHLPVWTAFALVVASACSSSKPGADTDVLTDSVSVKDTAIPPDTVTLPDTKPPPDTVTPSDTTPDSAADTVADTASDTAEDSGPDTTTDTVEDTGLDTSTDTAADSTNDSTMDSDDTQTCSPLPAPSTEPNSPALTIGKPGPDNSVTEVADGDLIEIVQGPQGGVHLEVAFHIGLPESFSGFSAKVHVEGKTYQPCCLENHVASYTNKKYLVFKDPNGGNNPVFLSGVIPVIFFQNLAEFYEEKPCCVVLKVGAYETGASEPTLWQTAVHTFQCIDFF
jgi:hypothetical protein